MIPATSKAVKVALKEPATPSAKTIRSTLTTKSFDAALAIY
jgi:hypothetical protein